MCWSLRSNQRQINVRSILIRFAQVELLNELFVQALIWKERYFIRLKLKLLRVLAVPSKNEAP